MMSREQMRRLLVAFPLVGLTTGLVARYAGYSDLSVAAWFAATLPVLAFLIVDAVASLKRGEFGIDLLAALSMSGALAFGETLAASIVALMYAGGSYLDVLADRRARREMTALLARAPRTALRYRNGRTEEVPVGTILPGDRLMIRRGDVIPADGELLSGSAVLDQSALTGEAEPVRQSSGGSLLSGATNVGNAFDMTARRAAAESTYAGIVRLVERAQAAKAPMARLADRYALFFLAATLLGVAATWWLTGDPLRVVAVLVVATPCPLILAVPVAMMSGVSCAARRGILLKGGKVIEAIASARSVVLDKTGTLTVGRPGLTAIHVSDDYGEDELLQLAASLDLACKHPMASALVSNAKTRGLSLSQPEKVVETPGEGVEGVVEGRRVVVGGRHFIETHCRGGGGLPRGQRRAVAAGTSVVNVLVDGKFAGEIHFSDRVRAGARAVFDTLRANGVENILLATGDAGAAARHMAAGLGFDRVLSDLTSDQKVLTVLSERKNGPVMMVGDGVNDAPALAAADVGVAMGARGSAASIEAADAVLLLDDLGLLVPVFAIARRTMRIAYQSMIAGITLSVVAMGFAAAGHLDPVAGALLQEAIDLAVVLNALRALSFGLAGAEGDGATSRR
ncbi:heavy metal translocating P-type ATPase [Martelella radicis]|uniref:P-type Zn(2+) transporter n=1 Tax=Martelella radicis TaxID=1397476 RepID=A0A7W6KHG0_9HYPH|nr:heavy metal translocating P-type ATPase [Martelella radicis]MBB4120274.1 heavy metal translocating P-type ATPase [Martelella radicis]